MNLSPVTLGGTSPRMQASVLIYMIQARLPFPMANGKEVSTFDAFDKMVAADLATHWWCSGCFTYQFCYFTNHKTGY